MPTVIDLTESSPPAPARQQDRVSVAGPGPRAAALARAAPALPAPRAAPRGSALQEAIDVADVDLLRKALLSCIEFSEVAEKLTKAVFTANNKRTREEESEGNWAFCQQCDEAFDLDDNGTEEPQCWAHSDEPEPMEEMSIWFRWEFACDGDTESMREQHPEAYTFPCCGESFWEPCTKVPHKSLDKKKRRKL